MFDILNSAFIRPSRDGRRKSLAEQKFNREKALRLRSEGATFVAIGRAVGVHPRTVQHWCALASEVGADVVISGGRRGATKGDRSILSVDQEREIVELITTRLPDRYPLWSLDALIALIRERFEVEMSRRTIANYLARWGIDQKILAVSEKQKEAARNVRRRATGKNELLFWAGQVTMASCSESIGYPGKGDIQMIYAVTGRDEIFFMCRTEEFRESRLAWNHFIDGLAAVAEQRKPPRRAFVLLPKAMNVREQLMTWAEWRDRRQGQGPVVEFVLPEGGVASG